jgi:heat-inducible transcriptional repressor
MSDAPMLENLTERQQLLLSTIVREFIAEPEPVSSKRLVSASTLNVSSATIRNEMVVLEDLGYIRSPHTSSGRIPTEKGYRYFVQQLLENPELPPPQVEIIQSHFKEAPLEINARMKQATVILAQQTHAAALVTEPRLHYANRFKHLQLIGVKGRLVMMILVLNGGHVHQQMLVMAETIPQEVLSQASEALTRVSRDQDAAGVIEHARNLPLLARDVAELASEAMVRMDELGGRVRYRTGLSNILSDIEQHGVQQALSLFEGQNGMDTMLDDMVDNEIGTVNVIIAGKIGGRN